MLTPEDEAGGLGVEEEAGGLGAEEEAGGLGEDEAGGLGLAAGGFGTRASASKPCNHESLSRRQRLLYLT